METSITVLSIFLIPLNFLEAFLRSCFSPLPFGLILYFLTNKSKTWKKEERRKYLCSSKNSNEGKWHESSVKYYTQLKQKANENKSHFMMIIRERAKEKNWTLNNIWFEFWSRKLVKCALGHFNISLAVFADDYISHRAWVGISGKSLMWKKSLRKVEERKTT